MVEISVRGRVGLWTAALDALDVPAARDMVAELDEQGWTSLWFGEAYGREAFTAAAVYLAASRRMTVGTGIASIYARDAMATAGAARTLAAAFPGRFLLGLGVSHAPLVERMRGHDYGRPVAAMTSYLDAVDQAPYLVAGSVEAPPRVLAALGPRMLALARDRAQGAHPYLTTPDHTAQARAVLRGTAENGPLLVVEQAAVVGDDEAGRAAGESMRAIAARLGCSPSTISRELARNAGARGDYRASSAHALAYERASRPKPAKLAVNLVLRQQPNAICSRSANDKYVPCRSRPRLGRTPPASRSHCKPRCR